MGASTKMPSETGIRYDADNNWISILVEGVEVMRIKSNGDIDVNTTYSENAF
jgi:hypothetical protein